MNPAIFHMPFFKVKMHWILLLVTSKIRLIFLKYFIYISQTTALLLQNEITVINIY